MNRVPCKCLACKAKVDWAIPRGATPASFLMEIYCTFCGAQQIVPRTVGAAPSRLAS